MKKRITIVVHSLNFVVLLHDNTLKTFIDEYNMRMIHYKYTYNYKLKRMVREPGSGYYAFDKYRNEWRYHINCLNSFIKHLGAYFVKRDEIELIYDKCRVNNVAELNLKYTSDKSLRDYQEDYVRILTEEPELQKPCMLIDLYTGYGKGVTCIYSMCKINLRTAIVLLPKYIEKWILELKELTDIQDKDICVIQGMESIRNLVFTPKEEINYKVIIFSLQTVTNWINSYEKNECELPMTPDEFFKHLSIGLLVNDESHQYFHALFKATLYFDANRMIGMSATMDSNDNAIKKLYEIYYPQDSRINNIVGIDSYIDVIAVEYKLNFTKSLRYILAGSYNHNSLEQSIIRNRMLLKDYVDMIKHYTDKYFISKQELGDKLLIYCSSIRMCTILADTLSTIYKSFDVQRYVGDDDYSNMLKADIIVSTPGSLGTAIDIRGLMTVINTVSISSLQANKQMIGRLRKRKDNKCTYVYFFTRDIPNQYKMHIDRKNAISYIAKSYEYEDYHKVLKVK